MPHYLSLQKMIEFSSSEHETTFNLSGLYANTEYDLVFRQRPPLSSTSGKDTRSTAAAVTATEHWSPAAVLSAARTAASSECSGDLDEGLRETTIIARFPLPVYMYLFVLCIHLYTQNMNVGLFPSAILIFE